MFNVGWSMGNGYSAPPPYIHPEILCPQDFCEVSMGEDLSDFSEMNPTETRKIWNVNDPQPMTVMHPVALPQPRGNEGKNSMLKFNVQLPPRKFLLHERIPEFEMHGQCGEDEEHEMMIDLLAPMDLSASGQGQGWQKQETSTWGPPPLQKHSPSASTCCGQKGYHHPRMSSMSQCVEIYPGVTIEPWVKGFFPHGDDTIIRSLLQEPKNENNKIPPSKPLGTPGSPPVGSVANPIVLDNSEEAVTTTIRDPQLNDHSYAWTGQGRRAPPHTRTGPAQLRPFYCPQPQCPKTFTQGSHVSNHIRSVHLMLIPKVECTECEKKYATRSAMWAHYSNVHLGIRFVCTHPYCGKIFTYVSNLRVHQRKMHGLAKGEKAKYFAFVANVQKTEEIPLTNNIDIES